MSKRSSHIGRLIGQRKGNVAATKRERAVDMQIGQIVARIEARCSVEMHRTARKRQIVEGIDPIPGRHLKNGVCIQSEIGLGQIGRIVIAVVHRRTDAHRDTRQRQRAAVEVVAPTARFKAEMLLTAGARNIKRTCSGECIINRDVARRVRRQVKRRTRTREFDDARAEVVVYVGTAREEVRICRNVNVAAKTAIGAVDVNGRRIGSVADLKTATTVSTLAKAVF